MLVAAAHAAGLTVLEDGARFHKFRSRGRGLTAFVLLSQSHLAIHTWPEAGMVAVDFLSYQDRPFEPAIAVLERALRPSYVARQGVGGLSFTERYGTHSALCIDATRVLASENSGLQRIHLFESPTFGRVLALDGKVRTTERDEFFYHESLVEPALHAHPSPKRVAIVGGGDLGAAREVLKHPRVEVDILEIDRRVLELCRRHFSWGPAVTRSSRVRVILGDAFDTLRRTRSRYDVILVDSTDPLPEGPATRLFSKEFYRVAHAALRPDGVLCTQSGSPLYYGRRRRDMTHALASVFGTVMDYLVPVPTYPFGNWGFTLATKGRKEISLAPSRVRCRLYSPAMVHAGVVMAASLARSGLDFSPRRTPSHRSPRD